jgi:subtilisin family serine protease
MFSSSLLMILGYILILLLFSSVISSIEALGQGEGLPGDTQDSEDDGDTGNDVQVTPEVSSSIVKSLTQQEVVEQQQEYPDVDIPYYNSQQQEYPDVTTGGEGTGTTGGEGTGTSTGTTGGEGTGTSTGTTGGEGTGTTGGEGTGTTGGEGTGTTGGEGTGTGPDVIPSPNEEGLTSTTSPCISAPSQQGEREGATLTLKKVSEDTDKPIPGAVFTIAPNPYTLDDSLVIEDNDGNKLDCNPNDGAVQLRNIQPASYTIQEIRPSDGFVIHQAEMPVYENLPNPVINFVERDFNAQGAEKMLRLIPNQYIIVLKEDIKEDLNSIADQFTEKGVRVLHVYDDVFKGLAINVKNQELFREIQNDSRVGFIEQDKMGRIASINGNYGTDKNKLQSIPTGINRIDADLRVVADRDLLAIFAAGNLPLVNNVDVAILDTGISLAHPDLNVYNHVTFINGTNSGNDDQGHGSHVAGIAAGKDNSLGIVGIAPGARLWAIKVCDRLGNCPVSSQIQGIEYVTEHADEIDVANISIENRLSHTLDKVINKSVTMGVTYVVAAGNSGKNASSYSPANNPSVISVSAIGDSDGKCGGFGRSTFIGQDDTFASFSNFGPVIDIAAPGVDILSTYNGTEYAVDSGTSTAAPHVTGVAALYKAANPSASPFEVYNALVTSASLPTTECDGNGHGYFQGGDRDDFEEPLLYVSKSN